MIFKIKVFETDFEVHVDDEGAVTAAYTSDDAIDRMMYFLGEHFKVAP